MPGAEEAISEHVSRQAAAWFPGTAPDPSVHLRLLSDRRRSRLYAVSLGRPAAAPVLVAKVRNENTAVGGGAPRRPTLAPPTTDEAELTALEYDALRHLRTVFPDGDPRFGSVRALAHLPDHHAIVMDLAPGVPLRQLLVRWSRLYPARGRGTPTPEPLFRGVGAWLRRFHDATPVGDRPVRQATGRDVVAHLAALEEFLGRRLGRGFGDLAGAGSTLAGELLPSGDLPLAVGHGDFAPRNVLAEGTGRLVVIDPLARWAVPAQEDLCRFLVGLELGGLQVHSRGAAHGHERLAHWQRQVVAGYYGDAVPEGALRCYELLVLLDKWSALVEPARRGGARATLLRLPQAAANGYVRARAERLLDLARSAPG